MLLLRMQSRAWLLMQDSVAEITHLHILRSCALQVFIALLGGCLLWHKHSFSKRADPVEVACSIGASPDLQGNMRIAPTDGDLEFRVKATLLDDRSATRPTHRVPMKPIRWVVFDNVALGKCDSPELGDHGFEHRVRVVQDDTITIALPTTADDPAQRLAIVPDPTTGEAAPQAWMEVLDRACDEAPAAEELAWARNKVADWLQPVLQQQVCPSTESRLGWGGWVGACVHLPRCPERCALLQSHWVSTW